MRRFKVPKGFTLVELLVVVVIIGILAAIALPNFIGAQSKAKTAAVRGNMRTSQIASESLATDAGGTYGAAAADLLPYYPGGGNKLTGAAGTRPTNPVTAVADEALGDAGLATTAAIITARKTAAGTFLAKGQHGYSQADAGNSYGIMGSDANGNHVTGTNGNQLVLSNQ